jgi:hypothetical protein
MVIGRGLAQLDPNCDQEKNGNRIITHRRTSRRLIGLDTKFEQNLPYKIIQSATLLQGDFPFIYEIEYFCSGIA